MYSKGMAGYNMQTEHRKSRSTKDILGVEDDDHACMQHASNKQLLLSLPRSLSLHATWNQHSCE